MSNLKIPKTIKMVISDFDGIMTDGSIYIDENLNMSRKVNFKDIMAISILKKNGYELAFISGEKNPVIDLLAEKFSLREIHQNIRIKIDTIKSIVQRHNLKKDEFLYIGDDINDLESLEFAEIKITVPNAVKKVKQIKNIQITDESGGNGAFREVVDCLLNS